MPTLGDLERAVMEHLWASDAPLTADDLRVQLADGPERRDLAVTTVLTVLARLEKKDFVVRERAVRPHFYRAHGTRESHMAELMHDVLGSAGDRAAVLERFVGSASPEETEMLRRLLG